MVRAVVQERYGSSEVLTLSQVPIPTPGPDEVLVAVRAASLNARDWHIMRGEPRVARLMDRTAFGRRGPQVAIRGTDLAGTVEAVGADVTRWRPGDHVFGEGSATLAEQAVVPAGQLVALPAVVTFEQAAAVPLAATTAQVLLDASGPAAGPAPPDQWRLRWRRDVRHPARPHRGARGHRRRESAKRRPSGRPSAPTTSSTTPARTSPGWARATTSSWTWSGNRGLRELRRVVRPGGALVLSGGGIPGEGRIIGPLRLLVWAQLAGRFSGTRVLTPVAAPDPELLERLAAHVVAGTMSPVIDRCFPLVEAAEAFRYLETQHATGKVVIIV